MYFNKNYRLCIAYKIKLGVLMKKINYAVELIEYYI
jgi:hypothetical protein